MAEKKTGAKATPAKETKTVKSNMVTRNYMKPRGIKDRFIKGSINGEDFKVPYNETVEITQEVAAVIDWSLVTGDFADEYIERVEQDPEDE